MTYTLGTNIKVGERIKTALGWRKIKSITEDGALVKEGVIKFGDTVYGWKSK